MEQKNKKHKGGRPSRYDPKILPQVRKFMLLGAKETELADFLEVNESTISRWENKYPEFKQAIKEGRIGADANVAQSLYKRATGYKHKAVKIFYDSDAASAEWSRYFAELEKYKDDWEAAAKIEPPVDAGIVRAEYMERFPPDLGSMIFWLSNRHPEKWQNKRQFDGNISSEAKHIIEWVEAPDCEPLKTPEELEQEFSNDENTRYASDDEQQTDITEG